MPKRALIEQRPWLLAGIVGAIAYFFLRSGDVDDLPIILLKGSGVAFLAVYAWHRSPLADAKLLALVMALSALGDMVIEFDIVWGGAAFFASHLAAMSLYLRNLRHETNASQKGAAVALLFLAPLVTWLISKDLSLASYGLALGGMAATAWMSKFSRYRVGLGAILFIVSDWLIFLNVGNIEANSITSMLIWPLYFSGQLLIATGVIQTLQHELPEAP